MKKELKELIRAAKEWKWFELQDPYPYKERPTCILIEAIDAYERAEKKWMKRGKAKY